MKKKQGIKAKIIIILIAVLSTFFYTKYKANIPLEADSVMLSKCTDGDTAHFMIDGKDKTVRFLAIDTPETVKPNTPVQPYGKEASNRTCSLLKQADTIRLEYESEKTDKYGRLLAWVFVDDQLLQLDLIENGYAKVAYIYGDYKYTDILQQAESKAKKNKVGLWSEE